MLNTNYVVSTVLKRYDILKLVAAQQLIKAWLRELMETFGGKAVFTPIKARPSEHRARAPYYVFPPHARRGSLLLIYPLI